MERPGIPLAEGQSSVRGTGIPEHEAQEWATLCRALADKTRVQILAMLSRYPGQVCVCHLVDALPLGQPTISHHLGVLRAAGLVQCEKRGSWAYYYLNEEALTKLRRFIDSILSQGVTV